MSNFRLNQRGDTIVEVLIAIAVISSVLAITYSTMNRNLQAMRSNQERTEATRLGQGQIEQLKTLAISDPDGLSFQGSSPFCINAGAISGSCTSTLYTYRITRDISDATLYRINVTWRTLSNTTGEINMAYKTQ